MDLKFNTALIRGYKSPAQQARILTEDWLARNMYCPICGENTIHRAEANSPVKDYVCQHCKSQYELKSKKATSCNFNRTVKDGVYRFVTKCRTALENLCILLCYHCVILAYIISPSPSLYPA